jgi:hypothetical protein
MEPIFDIFRTLPDGSPIWLESVEGLQQAKRRLNWLAQLQPGRYFIYSEKTGGVVERFPEHGAEYVSATNGGEREMI